MIISHLTKGRVFGESQIAKSRLSRLWPDVRAAPQAARFISGLANPSQISFCIPRRVGRDVNSGSFLSSSGAKLIELCAEGAILEHSSNSLEVPQGRHVE